MKSHYQFLFFLLFIITIQDVLAQDYINFTAETIIGNEIQFPKINDSGPTLITFWALWCKPCRAEMKHLERIYREYYKKGFLIIGINQDTPRSVAKVKSYVSSHGVSFPIITDQNQELFQMFNGQSIPLAILYDKDGKVHSRHTGYLPGDEIKLENEIRHLLGLH